MFNHTHHEQSPGPVHVEGLEDRILFAHNLVVSMGLPLQAAATPGIQIQADVNHSVAFLPFIEQDNIVGPIILKFAQR